MAAVMKRFVRWIVVALAGIAISALILLGWLYFDAHRPLGQWFAQRHGEITGMTVRDSGIVGDQVSELIELQASSGLSVSFRTIRKTEITGALPVLVVLGGHRTGSDAANLFGDVGNRAVVALDYPYAGPERIRGIRQTLQALPLARQAFRDTPPAIQLVIDWLLQQSWVDPAQLIIVGASLGVPFAAHAAARDERLHGVLLVHGAADNRAWLAVQIARRIDSEFFRQPLATLIHWLAYGPTYDTAQNIARVSPRPVLIVGARSDERTPASQTQQLFDAAREPKWLRWTDGAHVQPGRTAVVEDLLRIADEMLPFPPSPAGPAP